MAQAVVSSIMEPTEKPAEARWVCDVCKVAKFELFADAVEHEERCQQEQEAKAAAALHPFFSGSTCKTAPTNHEKRKEPSPCNKNGCLLDTLTLDRKVVRKRPAPSASGAENQLPKQRRSSADKSSFAVASKKPSSSRPPKSSTAPLASIFSKKKAPPAQKASTKLSMDAILAEHKFAAKRRAQAEQERERQRKRNEQRSQRSNHQHIMQALPAKRTMGFEATRFPNPSHVLGLDTSTQIAQNLAEEAKNELSRALKVLKKTAKHPSGVIPSSIQDCPDLLSKDTKRHPSDSLAVALGKLLKPPLQRCSNNHLWSDKYTMQSLPSDVCGEANRNAASQLIDFVEDWKQERQQVLIRMAEKRGKKKRRKRKVVEDDLWLDSDEEDDSLVNVCVLTGPCGTGKTSLVHAVARHKGCVVLELNSTERRGGQALKHKIEEATQSHSSLAMLSRTNSQQDDAYLSEEEQSENQSASVSMVLIDEVDNIFENNGDNGFWTALSSVARKAKCPVFVTANEIPDALLTSRIRFTSVSTSLPTPMECATKMCNIVRCEGFSWRNEQFPDSDAIKRQLAYIAELCGCDVRRIIMELQLFSYSSTLTLPTPIKADSMPVIKPSERRQCERPMITDVSPTSVASAEFTVLTIKGKNFWRFKSNAMCEGDPCRLEVLVGNQVCPAVQVMDDSTILAVCPPCLLSAGVNETGVFQETLEECLDCRYAPVTVRALNRVGLTSTSEGCLDTEIMVDGTALAVQGRHWNIAYCFSSRDELSSMEEQEFSWEAQRAPTRMHKNAKFSNQDKSPKALKGRGCPKELLEESVAQWKQLDGEASSAEAAMEFIKDTNTDDIEWLKGSIFSSDAALIEDSLEFGGIPHLSGAVRGFGHDLTSGGTTAPSDPIKLSRSGNAKSLGYDRLYSLGWNDNYFFHGNSEAYVTLPASQRDRQLLRHNESHVRGMSLPVADDAASTQLDAESKKEAASQAEGQHKSPPDLIPGVSEEDMFLPCSPPFPLRSLPFILREGGVGCHWDTSVLRFRTEQVATSSSAMLLSVVAQDRMAIMNGAMNLNTRDSRLSLDYLPILRIMAAHECAAEEAFQQALQNDPKADGSCGRRSTRRTKKLGRQNYFERVCDSRDDTETFKQLGRELARSLLLFGDSKNCDPIDQNGQNWGRVVS